MARDAKWYASWIRLLPASSTDEKMRNLEAADLMEELDKRVHRWISVEERLPDYDSTVLMFEQVGLFTAIAMGRLTRDEGFVTQDGFPADVTHWMPLPEPPKEKDSVR